MSSSLDDDVAALLELVALDDLRVRHLALAVRAPALLLDARLALGVELVERDRRRRLGRREHLDRDVDEADLEVALPGRSRGHAGIGHIGDWFIGSVGSSVGQAVQVPEPIATDELPLVKFVPRRGCRGRARASAHVDVVGLDAVQQHRRAFAVCAAGTSSRRAGSVRDEDQRAAPRPSTRPPRSATTA